MTPKRIIVSASVVLAVCTYLLSSISVSSTEVQNISIDAAKPFMIVWPCEISIVGDEGQKGFRIAPNAGQGWRSRSEDDGELIDEQKIESTGWATYKFYVPTDGKYCLWVYALWFDVCANAVFAGIDNMADVIVGNDPVYEQWHWVRGLEIDLTRGTHTLRLSNHSDHISIQEILFTNPNVPSPQECDQVFSDMFYDGFDGCDQGNFAQWRVISGNWQALNSIHLVCTEENTLMGTSDRTALIILDHLGWSDYVLNVVTGPIEFRGEDSSVGICFGLEDADNFYLLRLERSEIAASAKVEIVRHSSSGTKVLCTSQAVWSDRDRHDVAVSLHGDLVRATIDGAKILEVSTGTKIQGTIGFQLEGNCSAWFDDIHVRQSK